MQLKKSLVSAALAFFLGSSVLFTWACSSTGTQRAEPNVVVVASSTPAPAVIPVCHPMRIANDIDQTGSMGWTNTTRVTADEFRPLLPLLLRCGGELSITFIRSESNRPMFRFAVSEPTVEPVLLPRGEDEEPFKFSDRKHFFEKAHIEWSDKRIEREQMYGQKFEEFLTQIEPILKADPKGGTDFWGAVQRSKIMLSESQIVWNSAPHSYLVLVSDGVDTVGKPKVVLDQKIKVFWVDSKTDDSTLRELNAERFEAFSRALESILAIEGDKENGRSK